MDELDGCRGIINATLMVAIPFWLVVGLLLLWWWL